MIAVNVVGIMCFIILSVAVVTVAVMISITTKVIVIIFFLIMVSHFSLLIFHTVVAIAMI